MPSPLVQGPPLGVRSVHEPFTHEKPVAQSPSIVQVVRQAPFAPQT